MLLFRLFGVATLSFMTVSMAHAGQAGMLRFTPTGDSNAGSVKCETPLQNLARLPIRNGSANISGKVVTIRSSSELNETPHAVLVGSVLRTEANLESNPPTVTGLALFLMGDWANLIDDGNGEDTIFCRDGQLAGKIIGLEGEALSFRNKSGKDQKIPLSSILYMRSARVFVFKLVLDSKTAIDKDAEFSAELKESSFRPTLTTRNLAGSIIPLSQKTDSELGGLMAPIKPPGALGSVTAPGTLPGLSGANSYGVSNFGMSQMGMPRSSFSVDPRDTSFDQGADSNNFSTVKSKWGTQKLTVPPGMLD